MESPREHPPANNPPSTPRADASDAAQEDKRPPRAQRRAREVSSRYMMAVTSPSGPHLPPSSSSAGGGPAGCPDLPPPPPRKPLPKQKHHHQPLFPPAASASTPAADAERARARRSPSPQARRPPAASPSSEIGDSDGEGSWFGDENWPEAAAPAVSRSSETPIPSMPPAKAAATQRRRAVRLFREIGGEQQQPPPPTPWEHQKPPETLNSRLVESRFLVRKPRPGTPVVHFLERPAAAAITPRPVTEAQTLARTANPRMAARRTTTTQVSRSLQETLAGAGQPPRVPGTPPPPPSDREINSRSVETSPENSAATDFSEAETCSISSPGGLCDSPPICSQSSRARVSSECRSSMPEAELHPTMSSRFLAEGNPSQLDAISVPSSSHRALSPSLCHRSLNSALSSCQQRQLNATMSISRLPTSMRTPSSSARAEAVCFLPPPAAGKAGLDLRKGKKMSGRQEDVHTLRLLENRYLQWRFVNARAQAAVQARKVAAEQSLYGVSTKLSELRDSVTRKNIELGQLKSMKTVSTILEAQMPYLGEWATLEDDYLCSFSGAIKALQDASVRVPLIGNVRADVTEVGEALDSATNVLEALAPRVGCLETKADGLQTVLSDLAKVVSKERSLVEEFGDLLAEAHNMQVNECSLRIHLIQLKRAISV